MDSPVAVVIVAWNNFYDTQECIESILDQQFAHTNIFLVDNGSNIEPLDDLTKLFPDVHYIRSESNLGFAAGTNLGLREALRTDAEYYLILNNDTKADTLMLNQLRASLKTDNVGLVAPLIFYYDAPGQIWSSGGAMNKLLLMPLDSHNRQKLITVPTERTFLSGCCYLMKRQLLEKVGLFDERFFLYFEDLDFCKRVNNTGWKMMVIPDAKLFHKVSRSSGGQLTESERYHYAQSSGIYFRKYLNVANAIPVVLFRMASAIVMTLRLLGQGRIQVITCYLKGLYRGWFTR